MYKLTDVHSIWDRKRFWDSRTWRRVKCSKEKCAYCKDGWPIEKGVINV